jgi:hypothetical protein
VFFLVTGAWVAAAGLLMRPTVSLTAFATVVIGAVVYKIFLTPSTPAAVAASKA